MRRCIAGLGALTVVAITAALGLGQHLAEVTADTAIAITEPDFAIGQCHAALYCYGPQTAQALTGSPVRWTNSTDVSHSATGDGFDVTLAAGQGGAWTPTAPGTYAYHCRFWPDMRGTLVVAPVKPPPAVPAVAAAGPTHRPGAAPGTAPPAAAPPTATAAPAVPGDTATVLLPTAPAPDPGTGLSSTSGPPSSPATPRSSPPRSTSLGTSSTAARRPTAVYVIGALLFVAVAAAAAVRRGLRWWRRISADPLADEGLAGFA